MNWLISHVYVAAWLSPLIALVGLLIRDSRTSERHIPWSRVVVYIAFLTCLAAALTPSLDLIARLFGGTVMSFILGYFLVGGLKD